MHVSLIYRVHPSKANKIAKSLFIEEFSTLLEHIAMLPGKVLILGDFNVHWDKADDPERQQCADLLQSSGLTQHVNFMTHIRGHTLDFIITRDDDEQLHSVTCGDMIACFASN